MAPSWSATFRLRNSLAFLKVRMPMHNIDSSIKPWGCFFGRLLLLVKTVSWWRVPIAKFNGSTPFLTHRLLTIQSNVLLHAAMRIGVWNALFGGPSMENIRSHPYEQKSPSEGLCRAVKTTMIQSSSIWKASGRYIHPSGLIFPILTSS